jgi:O-antigen/teichoic acid export membrane protein
VASSDAKDERAGYATVTFGTLVLMLATILLVGFGFLARVLIVRNVSIASWNAFSLGYTLVQVILAVGTYGLTVAIARSLSFARTDEERSGVIRNGLAMGVVAAVAGGASLVALAPILSARLAAPQLGVGLELFGPALACLILATILSSVFQGFANVTPNALFLQIANPGLFLTLLAVAFFLPAGRVTFDGAVAAYAIASVLTLLLTLGYTARRLPRRLLAGPSEPGSRARLSRLILPLFVYGLMVSVAGSGDTLVLGAWHYAQVGAYSASLTLAKLVQIGISSASYIFLPVASGFLARGERRAVGLTYAAVTKWLTLFSLPLFVVFVFLPSGSLAFVYGTGYSHVVLPLQLVVVGAFVGTLLGPAAMGQVACGQARLLAVNACVAGAVDVGLALLLVPRYGQSGAAVSWAVSNVLYGSLCLAELAWSEGYHPFRRDYLLPLAVVGVPIGLGLGLVRPHLALLLLPAVAIGVALLLAVAILATGSIGEGDRLLLAAVEQRIGRPVPFVRWWARKLAPRPR